MASQNELLEAIRDYVKSRDIKILEYSTLTVTSTAQVLASTCNPVIPADAKGAIITVETDQVRFREDGTAPTASEGTLLEVGDVLNYPSWTNSKQNWRSVLLAVQFIRVTNNAALKIHWYD